MRIDSRKVVTYRQYHSVYSEQVLLDEGRHGAADRVHALHLPRQCLGESQEHVVGEKISEGTERKRL